MTNGVQAREQSEKASEAAERSASGGACAGEARIFHKKMQR